MAGWEHVAESGYHFTNTNILQKRALERPSQKSAACTSVSTLETAVDS